MRLSITPSLSTKDGTANRNARLTNMLKETRKSGDLAIVRPGLVLDAVASGVGRGLVVFNNDLVSVYGTTLGFGVIPASEIEVTDEKNISDQLLDVVAFNGGWVCTSAGQMYRTTDFITFTPLLTVDLYELSGKLASNGTVVITSFYNLDTDDEGVLTIDSSDTVTEVITNPIDSVIWSGTKFCAQISTTTTATSTDGTSWTTGTAGTSVAAVKLAYGAGVFVRLGYNTGTYDVYAMTSSDGLLWSSPVTIKNVSGHGDYNVPLVYGDKFIASGKDWVSTSTDGVTWDTPYEPYTATFFCVGIAYSSNTYVAVGSYAYYGDDLTKMVSTDSGATWTDIGPVTYNGIEYNGISPYGNGFVTYGSTVVSGAPFNIEILGGSDTGTIPALATITGDHYDFAQGTI